MDDKQFDQLLAGYMDGELSGNELSALHQAVCDSPERRRRFQEDSRLHVLLREAVAEQMELKALEDDVVSVQTDRPRLRPGTIWKAAAGIAAVVMLTCIVIFTRARERPVMGTCMHISGSGLVQIERSGKQIPALPGTELRVGDRVVCNGPMQAMLRLSDGSTLSMDPESSLTLVSSQPRVDLGTGEVLFEIAERQHGRPPFEVKTNKSKVDVMGTVFTLEAGNHTQLKVYEGSVNFTRSSDNTSVQVGSEQMTSTGETTLAVRSLSLPAQSHPVSVISLLPTDDVTLEHGKPTTDHHIKVEGGRRTAYLRFDIPAVAELRSAKLRLTQDIDPGSGTLEFSVGDHSDWTEGSLSRVNAPSPTGPRVQRSGVVQRHEVVEVDVAELISGPGHMTFVINLEETGGNDIWFGSKESDTPPQLIITYLSPR